MGLVDVNLSVWLEKQSVMNRKGVVTSKELRNRGARKRHPYRLMHFLWKSGFKVYVTMVVVLMDKINLSPATCWWVRALFIFEIVKAFPVFLFT